MYVDDYFGYPDKELAKIWRIPFSDETDQLKVESALRERIKELNCLYGISLLAERHGDVPLLARHFLRRFCQTHQRNLTGFGDEAMRALQEHDWPGNVRELENVVERAVLLSRGPTVDVDDLPSPLRLRPQKTPTSYDGMSLKEALAEPEKRIIRAALESHHWNRQETARTLQINRTTLYKKMKRYGLEDEARRAGL